MYSRDIQSRPFPPRFQTQRYDFRDAHGNHPRTPMFMKRREICRDFLRGRCSWGPRCRHIHTDSPANVLHSGGPMAVSATQTEFFHISEEKLNSRPPMPQHFAPAGSDTSSDESLDNDCPLTPIGLESPQTREAAISVTRMVGPDSTVPSGNTQIMLCPPGVCWDWCRGHCPRLACRFLHVKHTHEPLIHAEPIQAPTKPEKHPHPDSNEICWAWEHDWCQRGYDCEYVHGDLEYDSPVMKVSALPDEEESDDEPAVTYPRPPNSATCVYWLHGNCHRGPSCPYFHGDVNYEDPPDWPSPDEGPANQVLHPRPPRQEICRKWCNGYCQLGYDCQFVHGDLVYDEPIPGFHDQVPPNKALSASASEPSRMPAGSSDWTIFVHDHIKLRVSAGFEIQDLSTGFETPWIFIDQLPAAIPEHKVLDLLRPFGTVEIKFLNRSGNSTKAKAKFTEHVDARNASVSLDNTSHFGRVIRVQLSVRSSGRSGHLKDCEVRFEWDAPALVGYGGYPTHERAMQAIAQTRQPFRGRRVHARVFAGLPAVGLFTVRFWNLPESTTKEDMKVFADPIDMVWEPLSYTSVPEASGAIRRILSRDFDILEWDMTPPPYRDGFIRIFARFSNPAAAAQAAAQLHGRKPQFLGGNRISALHLKELSFRLTTASYNRIAADVMALRDRASAGPIGQSMCGLTVTPWRQGDCVHVKLFSNNLTELSRLKGEFEKIQRGQVVLFEDKTAWDRYFTLPIGIVFLQTLQRRHHDLIIERDPIHRRIILHGPSAVRVLAHNEILAKLKELRQLLPRIISLPGQLLGFFMASEYPKLKRELGEEAISIDLWHRNLIVRGTTAHWVTAKRAVQHASDMQQPNRTTKAVECPICFDEVASPCTLRCGHTHCRSCLKEYLLAATDNRFFPLTCLGAEANCTELLPLAAAKEILTTAEFNAVVGSAYTAYVATRPSEFRPCPTPDCPQVYRPGPPGEILQCPACLLRICSTCNREDHEGVDCPKTREQDRAFGQWKRAHDVKTCPGCKVDIERAEGCNHVTCTRCQTHICWVCSLTFPRGEGIYDHMRAAHGGIGLVPHF